MQLVLFCHSIVFPLFSYQISIILQFLKKVISFYHIIFYVI